MLHIPELTINWHILEACNYDCYFCYAKYGKKSNFSRDYSEILRDLSNLSGKVLNFPSGPISVQNIRINFAGGEPFLEKELGSAVSLASELGLRPSFISNGSLLTDSFIEHYGAMISVAGFSIDSFNTDTNQKIGRRDNKGRQVDFERFSEVFAQFRKVSPQTLLKINTVVCRENANDDFNQPLVELRPDRWKILRVIPIHGAEDLEISDAQFDAFLARHHDVDCRIVPEDNAHMHRSYLMLDPEGRFYQREGSGYVKSAPIVKVGAAHALEGVDFDAKTYVSRY
tara:strand:- start:672 stop:1526 length:855 start_codon:yes stop_codon:yes gene_type:complete